MEDANVTVVFTDRPDAYSALLKTRITSQAQFELAGKTITQFTLMPITKVGVEKMARTLTQLPAQTAKITYTSGTTGAPKGVCLSIDSQLAVAQSIAEAVQLQAHETHVCVLPLSTLLENVAGVYAALLCGASIYIPSADEVGINLEVMSRAGLNVANMVSVMTSQKASTAILTPELLLALTVFLERQSAHRLEEVMPTIRDKPLSLRFLAVGGASVSPSLLSRAEAVGLPVFEGYGLSECCSVVALNTEKHRKIGSVGKVLPHVAIQFAKDREVLVAGTTLLGYTHQALPLKMQGSQQYYPTGDIGRIDEEGYLYIIGRKKNMFITSFGRNVSPEWVERELKTSPFIMQAILFGEAKPWNTLLITPAMKATTADIQKAIDMTNDNLPDYARVHAWISTEAPFSKANGQLTDNGRLRREAIWAMYANQINAMYEDKLLAVHE